MWMNYNQFKETLNSTFLLISFLRCSLSLTTENVLNMMTCFLQCVYPIQECPTMQQFQFQFLRHLGTIYNSVCTNLYFYKLFESLIHHLILLISFFICLRQNYPHQHWLGYLLFCRLALDENYCDACCFAFKDYQSGYCTSVVLLTIIPTRTFIFPCHAHDNL